MPTATQIASYLDDILETRSVPDYASALNGLQLQNTGEIRRVVAAVDFSTRTINGAISERANLLIVHHGMFWTGASPFTGAAYRKLRLLFQNDIAVYSSHLPLDRHPTFGNNSLLATELGLFPSGVFAHHEGIAIGVCGESELVTSEITKRARKFSERWGGGANTSPIPEGRLTKKWAICTGAGASTETLREAEAAGIDTLIVGEGPYWTSIAADEQDLVIIYAGHYATETLGVRAITQHLSERYSIPWSFVDVPTAL